MREGSSHDCVENIAPQHSNEITWENVKNVFSLSYLQILATYPTIKPSWKSNLLQFFSTKGSMFREAYYIPH